MENKNHSTIKDTERPTGEVDKHEFQAETRMLLDIVARSLYSENEVNPILKIIQQVNTIQVLI